jgi:hypothetical protein
MKTRALILLLLWTAPLCASYVTRTFGEDSLLTAASGEPTLLPPAPYSAEKRLSVRLAGRALFFTERVLSFDNPVSLYNSYSVFDLESASVLFKPWSLLSLSLDLSPWKTFDYEASYRFPAGAPAADGTRTLDSAGSVRALRFSAVCHVRDAFSFGASAGLLFGGRNTLSSASYTTATNLDWTYSDEARFSAWSVDLHAGTKLFNSFRALALVSLPVALDRAATDETVSYPLSLGLRLSLASVKPVPADLYAEARWSPTSDLSVTSPSGSYKPFGSRDTVSFLVGCGIELKTPAFRLPVRLGYAYLQCLDNYFADKNLVFAGFDVPMGREFGLSLDAEFSKRNWRGDNVFYENDKLIDETAFTVKAGLTWKR